MRKMSKYLAAMVMLLAGGVALGQGWTMVVWDEDDQLLSVDAQSGSVAMVAGTGSLIARTSDGGLTWGTQWAEQGLEFRAVSFANDSVGMIAGNSGTILKTVNAGESWTTVQTGWMVTLNAAQMLNPLVGIAAGQNTVSAPLVYRTTDDWQTFAPSTFYIEHDAVNYEGSLTGIHYVNADTVYATAAVWDGHGAICRSTDGGGTWATLVWSTDALYALDFPTPLVGYAVGYNGCVCKTTDGGESGEIHNITRSSLYGVSFINADVGWVVGETGLIMRTTDGGASWQDQASGVNGNLHSISMADADTGFVVGDYGRILRTTTGGADLDLPPTPFVLLLPADSTTQDRIDVRFAWSHADDPEGGRVTYRLYLWVNNYPDMPITLEDTTFVFSFTQPWHVPGQSAEVTWYATATDSTGHVTIPTNGSGWFHLSPLDAVGPSRPGLVNEFGLSCYPNPFNPTATISFNLPRASDAALRVFDLAGRLVLEREFGTMTAGTHSIQFDGRDLASGVYFARLQAGDAQITKKMLLMR